LQDRVGNYFENSISRDLYRLAVGERLGGGQDREVYEWRADPRFIVKFEVGARSFQNVVEWETWKRVQDHPARSWFAPCHSISDNGSILVMHRTTPLGPTDRLPTKVPVFLTDLKRENFGRIDKRIVCHDYGMIGAILSSGYRTTKLKPARWD
jgi:hypothetical protein